MGVVYYLLAAMDVHYMRGLRHLKVMKGKLVAIEYLQKNVCSILEDSGLLIALFDTKCIV